jgi:hypothetical protein
MSKQGVRQGDMPASLLFSLVFTERVVDAFESLGIAADILTALWLYLDDITAVLDVPNILRLKDKLVTSLASINCHLNMKKCRVLADRCSEYERDLLRAAGFQLDFGCTRVLGLPVGTSHACTIWASNKVAGWSRFWANLSNPLLHPTVALSLLKFCGQAKFQHIAQALPPEVCAEAAMHFDTAVTAVLAARLQSTVGDCGPARDVLGIVRYTDHLAAFYEHTAAVARGDYSTSIAQIRARLFARGGSAATSSTPFVGRLVSSSTGPWSSAAFVPNVRLCASDFVTGVRIRCGLPATAMLPTSCTCGFAYAGVNTLVVNSHLLSCPHNVGNNWTTRHHGVTRAIQRVLTDFHIPSVVEPSYLERGRRPDLIVLSAPPITVDVSVTDPLLVGPEALAKRAQQKHEHYDDFARRIGVAFFPLIFETYGAVHPECDAFVRKVALDLPHALRGLFRRRVVVAIQHALLTGNAQVARTAAERALGHDTHASRWWSS